MIKNYQSWFLLTRSGLLGPSFHNDCMISIYTAGNTDGVRLNGPSRIMRLSVPKTKAMNLKSLITVNHIYDCHRSTLDQFVESKIADNLSELIFAEFCHDYDEAIITLQAEDAVLKKMLQSFIEAQVVSVPYRVLVPVGPGYLPCSWETIHYLTTGTPFGDFHKYTLKQLLEYPVFCPCNGRPRCNQLEITAALAEIAPPATISKPSSSDLSTNNGVELFPENSSNSRKPLGELSGLLQQQPKAATKHFVLQPWQRQLLLDKKGKRIKAIREQVHPVVVKLLAAPFDRKTLILRIEGNPIGVNHACSLFTDLFKEFSGGFSTYGDHVLVPY